ncbi:hypothetical protein BZG36_04457 [Bifiguratus adelaidae]|uniref:Uncharacterized protein n=1 Tax=Bifiguratus adelaidae TaxID=1938954 RepID=A0A261XVD1_9FUNG|nr:hypothetical protein BZG36_04457 [Bifiguratus adelaidae]
MAILRCPRDYLPMVITQISAALRHSLASPPLTMGFVLAQPLRSRLQLKAYIPFIVVHILLCFVIHILFEHEPPMTKREILRQARRILAENLQSMQGIENGKGQQDELWFTNGLGADLRGLMAKIQFGTWSQDIDEEYYEAAAQSLHTDQAYIINNDGPVLKAATRQLLLQAQIQDLTFHMFNVSKDRVMGTATEIPLTMLGNYEPIDIAKWYSHMSHWKHMMENELETMTIIQNNVKLKNDIAKRVAKALEYVPEGWDIIHLGHCSSLEQEYPAVHSEFPDLHPAHSPQCLAG